MLEVIDVVASCMQVVSTLTGGGSDIVSWVRHYVNRSERVAGKCCLHSNKVRKGNVERSGMTWI